MGYYIPQDYIFHSASHLVGLMFSIPQTEIAFFYGCVAAFQNDVDKHSPHIFLKNWTLLIFFLSPDTDLFCHDCQKIWLCSESSKSASGPLSNTAAAVPGHFSCPSPFLTSHHFPRTSKPTPSYLELLIQQTYPCLISKCRRNKVSRSGLGNLLAVLSRARKALRPSSP